MTDSGHQTITADDGLRVRTHHKGPETRDIQKQPVHTKGIQEPAILLPGQWTHNVFFPIEHYSRNEGLSTCAEHSGPLCKTKSGNTELNGVRASDDKYLNTSTVSGTREAGVYPMNEKA